MRRYVLYQRFLNLTQHGYLRCAIIYTKQDLAYVVNAISRFMFNLGKKHQKEVKLTLKYLRGSTNFGTCFGTISSSVFIVGYIDSYYVEDMDNRNSTTSYTFALENGLITWRSTSQSVIVSSTTEVEYMVITKIVKEVIWLKGLVC